MGGASYPCVNYVLSLKCKECVVLLKAKFEERELQAAEFTTVNEQRSNLLFARDRPKAAYRDTLLADFYFAACRLASFLKLAWLASWL